MPDTGKFIITYAHEKAGTFYQSTLSEINEVYDASWTITKGQHKKQRQCLITQPQFKSLWDEIASNELFARYAVADPTTHIDPQQYHAISIAFEVGGEHGVITHLVPRNEPDPAFKSWLKTLETTYSQRPAPAN